MSMYFDQPTSNVFNELNKSKLRKLTVFLGIPTNEQIYKYMRDIITNTIKS